jgi:hypothetical protein
MGAGHTQKRILRTFDRHFYDAPVVSRCMYPQCIAKVSIECAQNALLRMPRSHCVRPSGLFSYIFGLLYTKKRTPLSDTSPLSDQFKFRFYYNFQANQNNNNFL